MDRFPNRPGFGYAPLMRSRFAPASLVAAAIALGGVVIQADSLQAKEIRRDPDNRKGISPYMELVVKGDASFVARDLPGAISAFQEAIKLKPDEMLGFYRLGEAELESGKLDDADKAIVELLQTDGRLPYTRIAEVVGLSEAATRQRVQRLVEDRVVQIVAVTDPLRLGFRRQAMIGVRTEGDITAVADTISDVPEIDYVVFTSGSNTLLF